VTVTVVICTRNRPALLTECLAGVQKLSPASDQVLVIDNSDGDPETESVSRLFGARYIVEPTPGLKAARGRAVIERQTDMLVFLSDDVVPAEGWLTSMLPGIDAAPDSVATSDIEPRSPTSLM
jgi:glycosyltransferase involved in cell wall biosynthesis